MSKKKAQEQQDEVLSTFKERLGLLDDRYKDEYERQAGNLQFMTGEQYTQEEKSAKHGRPMVVANFSKMYVDRVVNPLIMNPIGIKIEEETPLDTIVQKMISDIESSSNANDAYSNAYEGEVGVGRGFIHVRRDYKDDVSTDQEIKIDKVMHPGLAWLDPASEEVDGSDSQWGMIVRFLSKDQAKRMYGDDAVQTTLDVYANVELKTPEGCVPCIYYYTRECKKVRRGFGGEGSFYDFSEEYSEEDQMKSIFEEKQDIVQTIRTVHEYSVVCHHIVGEKIVDTSVMPNCKYIPIVPALGYTMYKNDGIQYGGIIDQVKDTQRQINYLKSRALELQASAPLPQWVIAEEQTEGYEDIWKSANRNVYDALVHKTVVKNGVLLPAPMRVDNTSQTQGLEQAVELAKSDMARETGLFDPMFGNVEGEQSGTAILYRNQQGELTTAGYMENLQKSIRHCGRIILEMLPIVYDSTREVEVDGETVQVNLPQYMEQNGIKALSEMKFDVFSGPSLETRRKEAAIGIKELANSLGEDGIALADAYVENLSIPNKDAVQKQVRKVMEARGYPVEEEGNEEAPDPEVMQMLEQADQTIQGLEQEVERVTQIAQQYQTALLDNVKDRETQLRVAMENNATKERIAQLQAEVDMAKINKDNFTKVATEDMKQEGDTERKAMDIVADADKREEETFLKAMDVEEKVESDLPPDGRKAIL